MREGLGKRDKKKVTGKVYGHKVRASFIGSPMDPGNDITHSLTAGIQRRYYYGYYTTIIISYVTERPCMMGEGSLLMS